jgi:dihydroorotase
MTYRYRKNNNRSLVHHLWFSDKDYERLECLSNGIAIKTEQDKEGLLKALLDDRIDIITTDHAPHTLEEKQNPIFNLKQWFSISLHVRVL